MTTFPLEVRTGDPGNEAAEDEAALPPPFSSSRDSDLWVETDLAEPELMEPVPGRKEKEFFVTVGLRFYKY